MIDKEIEQRLRAKLQSNGYALNPERYFFVRQWNMTLFQLDFARHSMETLIFKMKSGADSSTFSADYSLMSAAVLAYCKCFSGSGRGQVKLDANQVFKKAPGLRPAHTELFELRNKLLAHNDAEGLSSYVYVGIGVKESDHEFTLEQYVGLVLPRTKFFSWLEVFTHAQDHAKASFRSKLDSLAKSLGKKLIYKEPTEL